MLSTSQTQTHKVLQRMLFRIHKWITNYLVVLPLLETSPSPVSPVLGIVTTIEILDWAPPSPVTLHHFLTITVVLATLGEVVLPWEGPTFTKPLAEWDVEIWQEGRRHVFLRSAQYQMPRAVLMGKHSGLHAELQARTKWQAVHLHDHVFPKAHSEICLQWHTP